MIHVLIVLIFTGESSRRLQLCLYSPVSVSKENPATHSHFEQTPRAPQCSSSSAFHFCSLSFASTDHYRTRNRTPDPWSPAQLSNRQNRLCESLLPASSRLSSSHALLAARGRVSQDAVSHTRQRSVVNIPTHTSPTDFPTALRIQNIFDRLHLPSQRVCRHPLSLDQLFIVVAPIPSRA